MNMHESGEMYLETILRLSEKYEIVRAIDIAQEMGFSKPSVSRAMKTLSSNGYITINPDTGSIRLLEPGKKIAETIYERHKLLTEYLAPHFSFKQFTDIVQPLNPLKLIAFEYYSVYAEQNKIEIARYDNYGEIFFSPKLLADIAPIKKDTDRHYAICIGVLPQFEFFLSSGMLDACIYDDFYGWGYIGTRILLEKIHAPKPAETPPQTKLLPPLVATPENLKMFVDDWKKWLK